jgi:hypothetical protein
MAFASRGFVQKFDDYCMVVFVNELGIRRTIGSADARGEERQSAHVTAKGEAECPRDSQCYSALCNMECSKITQRLNNRMHKAPLVRRMILFLAICFQTCDLRS